MKRLIVLLCGAILGMVMPAQAQVYRWVDEYGVTHFGDKAPENQRPDVIRLPGTPQPPQAKPTSSRHAYDPQKLQENERKYQEAVAAERRARERRQQEMAAQ